MPGGRSGLFDSLAGAALPLVTGAIPLALRSTRLRPAWNPLRSFGPAEYGMWAAVAQRVLARDAASAAAEGDGAEQAALRGERRPVAPSPIGMRS